MADRAEMIVQHFAYLVSEYDFHIEQKEFAEYAMGNAVVVYKSSSVGIEIVVDRNQVFICIGDQADPRREWIEFSNALKYFAPSIEQTYIFTEKTSDNTWDEVVEIQLKRLSTILRKYCEPFLKGDFSGKDEMERIQEKQVKETIEQPNASAKYRNKENL